MARRRLGRGPPHAHADPGAGRNDPDRARSEGRRLERHLQRLQPRRRSARRRPSRRRLRRLPVAPLEVPLPHRRGRARFRGGPRPELCGQAGERARPGRRQRPNAATQEPARAPPARPARSARARPRARRRHLDHGDGPLEPALLGVRGAARPRGRPRAAGSGRRVAADPAGRAQLLRLRGLLLEERQGLHLAVLDHPDGRGRSARPRLQGARPLGRRDPGRDADPLGRRELALLQDGRAHELHPEPDHHARPRPDPRQGRGLHRDRRPGQRPGRGRADAGLLRRARLPVPAVPLRGPLARLGGRGHGAERRGAAHQPGAPAGRGRPLRALPALAARLMESEHTLERVARGGRKAHALTAKE